MGKSLLGKDPLKPGVDVPHSEIHNNKGLANNKYCKVERFLYRGKSSLKPGVDVMLYEIK